MKKNLFFICLLAFPVLKAQDNKLNTPDKNLITVSFESEDPLFDPAIKEGLVNIILEVYPKLVKDFNPEAIQHVKVKIDTAYTGVAYANDGQVTISSAWMKKRPGDLDLITHEVMHIIQSYPSKSGPGWLTEGIADYVRHVYGVDNVGAGWSLPNYDPKHKFTDSYRVTARFLLWVTEKYDKDLVVKLDRNLRNNTYSPELWKEYTGKTIEELWEEYIEDPLVPSLITK